MTAALYCLIGYVASLVSMMIIAVVLMLLARNEEEL
jgi:hypothetical protein